MSGPKNRIQMKWSGGERGGAGTGWRLVECVCVCGEEPETRRSMNKRESGIEGE